jgi:glycosyltransferase involved in cell wall biosynthesis
MLKGAERNELEVIVVCNGCGDETATIARQVGPPVTVLETAVASKTHALNLGDETASSFPRFYIDADITIPIASIRAVAEVLRDGPVLAAAPRLKVMLERENWFVRAWYDIWTRLPYHREGMVGSGVYAVSEKGRKRFDRFPEIISDDGFFRLQFAPNERKVVQTACFEIQPPKTLRGIINVKIRSRRGKYQLGRKYPELRKNEGQRYRKAIGSILGTPRLWLPMLVYCYVALVIRVKSYWILRFGDVNRWERDDSSRTG